MLDGAMRTLVTPWLERLARKLSNFGISANAVTLAGLACALACAAAIAIGEFWAALFFLMLSRIADGLDGALARQTRMTDFGGYLDIVCDFVFYAGVPLGFAVLDPGRNGFFAAILLASFYINAATFLGFAALAARRGMTTQARGPKALYFTTGLAEGTETIAVFVLFLLVPGWFPHLAMVFAALCLITAVSRVLLARRVFAVDDSGDTPG